MSAPQQTFQLTVAREHDGSPRGFYQATKRPYAALLKEQDPELVEEFMIGFYHDDGSCVEEFAVRFYEDDRGEIDLRLEVFTSALPVLLMFPDLLFTLGQLGNNLTPESLREFLLEQGFTELQ